MMRHLLLFLWLSAVGLVCWSCDIETSSNGDLDGYWHLERIDTISNPQGGTCDYGKEVLFWSFQHHLAQLSGTGGNSVVCRMEYGDGLVKLSLPCLFDHTTGDSLLTDVEPLRPYGVNSLAETFTVVSLTSERLVLETLPETPPQLRLSFRKY